MSNGSEILHHHGGRRLTVPGVGLVEVVHTEVAQEDGSTAVERLVVTLEPLSPEQREKLMLWLRDEWPKRTN